MKLLITTQAVDKNDPVLGFLVRWLQEFALHCEQVTVICLREGVHELPQNVRVLPLGKNRLSRALGLVRRAFALRGQYEAVLVHMNPEYLVAAGWLWRLLGKKTALWYTHKHVDLKLRLAVRFADVIFTASKESFRLPTEKLRVMGHGIDTDFFSPAPGVRGRELLSVGRLSASKRHELVLQTLAYIHRELWIAGEGPELEALEERARKLQVAERVHFLGARTQSEVRELYRKSGVLAHTSQTGSLDKVVLEALVCGLPVVSTSEAFSSLLGPAGYLVPAEPKALAAALDRAIGSDVSALTAAIRAQHSLQNLIPAILKELK